MALVQLQRVVRFCFDFSPLPPFHFFCIFGEEILSLFNSDYGGLGIFLNAFSKLLAKSRDNGLGASLRAPVRTL